MEGGYDSDDGHGVEINESVSAENMNKTYVDKRKRKRVSDVWKMFEMLPLAEDKKERCKCKKCGTVYLASSKMGTGNLKRHINDCVMRNTKDIGQLMLNQSEGSLSMRSSKFDPEKFRELVTVAIIKHDLPFQFVEYEAIRALFAYVRDDIKLVTRNTAKADVLRIYKREKGRVLNMLQSVPGRISLTSDLWTSITTDGYICLTAHFVDQNWVLQKLILNFCLMPPPHTGVAIAEKIYILLTEWGIEKKLFSITLDNASSNDVFVAMLKSQLNLKDALLCFGEFFHVRCCAHILNLILQDGLKEIDDSILKIRESVEYVKGSQSRKQNFMECVAHVFLEYKKGLRQDVPTRWNSTFFMLENALFYRRAFCHLQLSDSNFKACPTLEEWGRVEKVCKFLGLIHNATNIFSGTKYPTANLYFKEVFLLQLNLFREMNSSDSFMRKMVSQIYTKFEKYWSEYSIILGIAVILDPRYKIQFVEWSYQMLYGIGSIQIMHVREKLFALFDEYMRNYASTTSTRATKSGSGDGNDMETNFGNAGVDVLKDFDTFESQDFVSSASKTQLELYLDEPRYDRNKKLDVLMFWKTNQYRYHKLSLMARDILSIPVSTVASESAFSGGGRVLDQFRSALKPETMEALICTRDWLYGDKVILEPNLDELTEDIMNLTISQDASQSSQASTTNTVNLD